MCNEGNLYLSRVLFDINSKRANEEKERKKKKRTHTNIKEIKMNVNRTCVLRKLHEKNVKKKNKITSKLMVENRCDKDSDSARERASALTRRKQVSKSRATAGNAQRHVELSSTIEWRRVYQLNFKISRKHPSL